MKLLNLNTSLMLNNRIQIGKEFDVLAHLAYSV